MTDEVQHDLDKLGIAKTAREEKKRARDAKLAASQDQAHSSEKRGAEKNDAAYDARMAQLYREVVLKEKPAISNEGGFIPLGAIATSKTNGNGHNGNGHSNGNGLHGIKPAKQTEDVAEPVAGD